MIIERIIDRYAEQSTTRGNAIRGSRLGECQRALAYAMWPGLYPPEEPLARRKMVWAMGRDVEARLRKDLREVWPGRWGMEEEAFFLSVQLTGKEATSAEDKFANGFLKGSLIPAFNPHGDLTRWRQAGRGLVLDPTICVLWVPIHVDGIADVPDIGLTTVEIKSYSSPGFRMVSHGEVGYSYRVQLAVEAEATGLDSAAWIMYRKETSHLLELFYSRKVDAVKLIVVRHSGQREVFVPNQTLIDDAVGFEIYQPFEPEMVEAARRRVRRVLLARPDVLPDREYGVTFVCPTCEGTTTQTMRKDRSGPLKTPKPCEDCQGGTLDEVALSFPCSYCDWKTHCWPIDRAELSANAAPKWMVKRLAVEKAGIIVTPPESVVTHEEEVT